MEIGTITDFAVNIKKILEVTTFVKRGKKKTEESSQQSRNKQLILLRGLHWADKHSALTILLVKIDMIVSIVKECNQFKSFVGGDCGSEMVRIWYVI